MSVGAFTGIFALMFVLELPDKTFLATVIMSTRARPTMIALGGSIAMTVHMALAVGAGQLLTLLPSRLKELIIALLFLAGAAYLLFVNEKEVEEQGEREAAPEKPGTRWKEVTTAFVIIFIGEFGDLTQIQAANLAAKFHQPLEVFTASALAMICVTCLGAFSGRALQRRVPLQRIRLGGGLIFAGLGLWSLATVVFA